MSINLRAASYSYGTMVRYDDETVGYGGSNNDIPYRNASHKMVSLVRAWSNNEKQLIPHAEWLL